MDSSGDMGSFMAYGKQSPTDQLANVQQLGASSVDPSSNLFQYSGLPQQASGLAGSSQVVPNASSSTPDIQQLMQQIMSMLGGGTN